MRIIDIITPLLERRRNPEVNRKVGVLQALRKYANKQVFVSFTHDVTIKDQQNRTGPEIRRAFARSNAKLGINPRTTYGTPVGIYTYPINYVLEKSGRMEFGSERPYLWVVEPNGRILDLATYSKVDLQSDIEKLSGLSSRWMYGRDLVRHAMHDATVQTPGGQIWNITRKLAQEGARARLESEAEDKFDPDEDEDDDNYQQPEVSDADAEAAAPPVWNRVFRSLGYVGVWDSKGEGIIHSNEPKQAVFFSRAGMRVLELVHNIRPEEPMSEIGIYNRQPRALVAAIRNGMSDERLIQFLDHSHGLVAKLGFDTLPEAVKAHIRDHANAYFRDMFGGLKPGDIGLNDQQMHGLLMDQPGWASTLPSFSPAIHAFVLRNPMLFRDHFDQLPLSDTEKLQVMAAHPDLYTYIDKTHFSPFLQKYMLEHDPDTFAHYMWSYAVTPESYMTYFVQQILKGPAKRQRDSFLDRLLHQDENYRKDTFAAFLGCFAKMPSPQAVTYARTLRGRNLPPPLVGTMIRLKPAIAPLLQDRHNDPTKWSNYYQTAS